MLSSRSQRRSRHKCRKDKHRHKRQKNSILSPHTKLSLLSHSFSYPPSPKSSQRFRDFAPSCFSRSVLRPSAVPCVKCISIKCVRLQTEPSKTFSCRSCTFSPMYTEIAEGFTATIPWLDGSKTFTDGTQKPLPAKPSTLCRNAATSNQCCIITVTKLHDD